MPKVEIPLEIDNIDEVPEYAKPLYVAKDGGGYSFKDVSGMEKTLRDVKTEKAELQEQARALKAQMDRLKDVDPEEYKSLKAKKQELDQASAEASGEIQRVKEELKATFEERERRAREEADSIWRNYSGDFLQSTIERQLAAAGVPERRWNHARRLIEGDIKVDREGSRPVIRILDEHGKPRLNKDADPMSISDLIQNLRSEFPEMFPSGGSVGSGAGSSSESADLPQDRTPSKWTEKQKRAFIERNGHDAYRKLTIQEADKKRQSAA